MRLVWILFHWSKGKHTNPFDMGLLQLEKLLNPQLESRVNLNEKITNPCINCHKPHNFK